MPGKKLNLKTKLKSWKLIAVVVSSVAVIASGVGVFAYEKYTEAQITSTAAQNAIGIGQQKLEEASSLVDQLELAIREAEQIALEAEGKTLNEEEYLNFVTEIEKAKLLWVDNKTRVLELEAAVQKLKGLQNARGQWDASAPAFTKLLEDKSNENWGSILPQIATLSEMANSTQTAKGQWQNEQDRIAAEQAAAAAAAKAAADNLARQSTEPTGIAIATPASNAVPCVKKTLEESPAKQSIADFIFRLAPNAETTWACGICAPGQLCGQAWLPVLEDIYPGYAGLPQNESDARVIIVLDENHIELYITTQGGVSVLVHEAAHARQHVKYGTTIRTANEPLTGLVGNPAVEYMADCATIVKIGYSTGAYTKTCTPTQLEAAATIW